MADQPFVITDRLWQHIAPLLPGKTTYESWRYRTGNRLFPEGLLWKVRTGALPGSTGLLGELQSVRCFRPWFTSGVFQRLFESLSGDPHLDHVLINRTIVPVHQKAAGANWWMPWADLVGFLLLPGQTHQSRVEQEGLLCRSAG